MWIRHPAGPERDALRSGRMMAAQYLRWEPILASFAA
jgi:hypothetical protein